MSDIRFSDEQLELVARVIKWIQTQRHLPNREPFDDAERAALARHRASALELLQAEASPIGWTVDRAPS